MKNEKLIHSLKDNRYKVSWYDTAEAAAEALTEQLQGLTIGFGDSATLAAMGLAARLSRHNQVFDPSCFDGEAFIETARKAMMADVFITSVNAVAESGELVNIDSTGNRVAGSLFGHKKVYFVIGTNKVVPDLQQAIWRARNVAAPKNAQRFGYKTPCALRGDRCYNCASPDRICNTMNIHLKKMKDVEAEVILIDKELGM